LQAVPIPAVFIVSGSRVAVGAILVAVALVVTAMTLGVQRSWIAETYLDVLAWLIAGLTLSSLER